MSSNRKFTPVVGFRDIIAGISLLLRFRRLNLFLDLSGIDARKVFVGQNAIQTDSGRLRLAFLHHRDIFGFGHRLLAHAFQVRLHALLLLPFRQVAFLARFASYGTRFFVVIVAAFVFFSVDAFPTVFTFTFIFIFIFTFIFTSIFISIFL